MIRSVAIVGASLAGSEVANGLRARGYDGAITLIGEEPWHPYQRPPLSKDYLRAPDAPPADFFLREPKWYADNRVDLIVGSRVARLDRHDRRVQTDKGAIFTADRIILATGARARRLSLDGQGATNIYYLRTREDADRLAAALVPGATIIVVGMGVIGAEIASSAIGAGCRVIGVEPGDGVMSRTLGSRFGAWLADQHRLRGVDLRLGTQVRRFLVEGNRAVGVELSDGSRVEGDAIVAGIGAAPAIELAAEAGLDTADGIVVDGLGRTSADHVFAVGDVANQPGFFGERVRMETLRNAVDQSTAVAAAILGDNSPYCRPCSFWSDQLEMTIQVSGRIAPDAVVARRGDMETGRFTALFLREQVVEGVLTTVGGQDLAAARRLIERRVRVDPALARQPDVPLRNLIQ